MTHMATPKTPRMKKSPEAVHELRHYLGEAGQQLTPQEAEGLLDARQSSVDQVRDLIGKMPSTEGLIALAKVGEKHKGWYQEAAKDLKGAFGEEAPRFIALLAATSANKGIKDNFRIAAYIWKQYKQLQKATGGKVTDQNLKEMMEKISADAWTHPKLHWLKYSTGEGNADTINAVRALDPQQDAGNAFTKILGGATTHKIDNFRKNILGNLMAVTNDVWVAKTMGIQNKGPIGKEKGFEAPSGHAYTAYSVKIRDVAKKLGWTPAEVQAAMWQGMRQIALNYLRGQQPHSRKIAWQNQGNPPLPLGPTDAASAAAGVSEAHIEEGGSFSNLLKNPEVQEHLPQEAIHYLKALKPPTKSNKPSPSPYRGLLPEHQEALQPIIKQVEGGKSTGWGVQPSTLWQAKKRGWKQRYAEAAARPTGDGSLPPPGMSGPQAGQIQSTQQGPGPQAGIMVSPNQETGLSFEQANSRRESGNHKTLEKIIKGFSDRLGVKAKLHSAIGAWKDGAENSIYQQIDHPINPETTRYLGALYGQYANQKQVLIFHANPAGKDALYHIELPGHVPLDEVHKLCLKFGIDFQTILPQKDKTALVLYDEGRASRSKVAQLGASLHATVSESPVTGESLGDPSGSDPAAARSHYRKIIDAYEEKHPTPANTGSLQTLQQGLLGNNGGTGQPQQFQKSGKVRLSGVQSPANGVVVRGIFYPGGKYIPQDELEKSNYDQYQQVGARRAQLEKARLSKTRRGDGSVPTDMKIKYASGVTSQDMDDMINASDRRGDYSTSSALRGKPRPPVVPTAKMALEKNSRGVLTSVDEARQDKEAVAAKDKADKAARSANNRRAVLGGIARGIGASSNQVKINFSKQGEDLTSGMGPRKIPRQSSTEETLESGGLPRPPVKAYKNASGVPTPPPPITRKPKAPYGGFHGPYSEEKAEETPRNLRPLPLLLLESNPRGEN